MTNRELKIQVLVGTLLGDSNLQSFTNPPQLYRLGMGSKIKQYSQHLFDIYKNRPNQWKIFISSKSYSTFKDIVFPYMIPEMLYKIHV